MVRALGTLLVTLATLTVAEGALLRPCYCAQISAATCATCQGATPARQAGVSRSGTAERQPSCCHAEPSAAAQGADEDAPRRPSICPAPRDPFDVARVKRLDLGPTTPAFLAGALEGAGRLPVTTDPLEAPARPVREACWRTTPPGLCVFLV